MTAKIKIAWKIIGSVVMGIVFLAVIGAMAMGLIRLYDHSAVLGTVGIVVTGLLAVLVLPSMYQRDLPQNPQTIALMTYWGEILKDQTGAPRIKQPGARLFVPWMGYSGIRIMVAPREENISVKAFTKNGIEVEIPWQLSWEPVHPGPRILEFHRYTSDAHFLFPPPEKDPRGKKIRLFLDGIIESVLQQEVGKIEKFEDVKEKLPEVAKAVEFAIEYVMGKVKAPVKETKPPPGTPQLEARPPSEAIQPKESPDESTETRDGQDLEQKKKDLGIEVLRINPRQPKPPADYQKEMERMEKERLQRIYEKTDQETVEELTEIAHRSSGHRKDRAYDRVIMTRAEKPDQYARLVEAETRQYIADAIRDGAKAIADAVAQALGKRPQP